MIDMSRCPLKLCVSEPLTDCLGVADKPGTFIDDQIELSTLYGQMLPRRIFCQTLDNTTKKQATRLTWKEQR